MSAADTHTTTQPKFHAVIAYVPEEFIWCDWLHQQLHDTAVPPALVGQRTRHGFTRPARLQVFPDPRNAVHLARCATALPPCRYLVVVCSPHSAKSSALDEQVRSFKRTETEDRIVVLVVDGDLDHGHEASAPAGEAGWLPVWLRCRLDENGGFRPPDSNERLIIDARSGKLTLPEARAHLLAALLDVPRSELLAHGDLVSTQASNTLVPVVSEAPSAPSVRRGYGSLLVAAACLVLGVGGAFWWMSQTAGETESRLPSATNPTASLAEAEPAPAPADSLSLPVQQTPIAAEPTLAPPSERAPSTTITQVTSTPRPTVSKTPEPTTTVTVFAPSDGPETPVRSVSPSLAAALSEPGAKDWRRMRDLGDTLFERGNREAGLIALSRATEIGLRTASTAVAKPAEQLEIAGLCFRVGALQKQFFSPAEAKRTLEGARSLLQKIRADGELDSERDALLGNLDRLLQGAKR
jgi:hypothetical protein